MKEKVIGGVILVVAVVTTCAFESAMVRSVRSFEEGRNVVVSLEKPKVSAENEEELVHFSGLITTTETAPNSDQVGLRLSPFVLDETFGIAVKGVKLHRHVEMLQWVETSHTSTSSTPEDEDRRFDDDRERIYMYDLKWKEERIDSRSFDDLSHWNPPEEAWLYKSLVVRAKNVIVGEFSLPDELVDQIERQDRVQLNGESRRVMKNIMEQWKGQGWEEESALDNVTMEENYFYVRTEQRDPVLGDIRVYFKVTPNYPVTVCAKQQDGKLVPFRTNAGDPLFLLEDGIMTAGELFHKKTEAKVRKNWFSRLFAFVLGFMGFLVLRIPMIKRFGPILNGIQQHLLASSMSLALVFSFVGANWLLYRPLWSILMWIGGWMPSALLVFFHRTTRQKAQ